MALTQYGIVSTTLTPTTYSMQSPTAFTITGFSYTNPNVTITTSVTHNIVVGQQIAVYGIVHSGTPVIDSTYNVTAVGSNTITFNYGATTPGTYTSGGLVRTRMQGQPSIIKYVNGTYFAATDNGSYFYSSDGINWIPGTVPTTNSINGIDWDGTTYAVCTYNGQIYTSTTLAPGSWTNRSNLTKSWYGIKWLGGSTNKWIVYGAGSGASTVPGTSGDVYIASSGAATWTAYSVTGSTPSEGWTGLAFDGNQTIALISPSALAVSTNATASFIAYTRDSSYRPNGVSAQLSFPEASSCDFVLYNPVAAKWMALMGGANNYVGMSTAGALSSPWTKMISQTFIRSMYHTTSTSPFQLTDSRNMMQVDTASGKLLTYTFDAGVFTAYGYNLTPTSLNTLEEFYPLVSVQTSTNIPGMQYFNSATGILSRTGVAGYFNNKWVLFYAPTTSRNFPNNYNITILQ
jgi:hypothetical protein